MTDQTKALTVTNYDKIKALAHNQATIKRFSEMLGSKPYAMSYISSAMLAVANSPDLMECTPSSVFNSVMRAAALRLSCDPAMKQAHIVPFYNNKTGKRDAQFIPGYVGLNQMAMRTGKYRVLNCSYIREGQVIDIDELTGVPNIHGQRTGDTILGYFHYFELFDGFKHILYMTVEELHAHGQKYAAKNPMWKNSFDAMARKTVTRLHLLKNGILDPYDRSMVEAAAEDIDQESAIINREDTVDGSFTDADDETAAAEAAAQKLADANKPLPTEAETLKAMGIEPNPAPIAQAEQPPAQDAPATETPHVVYTGTLIGYGAQKRNLRFPQAWMTKIPAFVKEQGYNAFEVAEIMWSANLPQDTPVDEVIYAINEHLASKPA